MIRTSQEVITNLLNLADDLGTIAGVADKGGDISLMLPILANHYALHLDEVKQIQFGTVDSDTNPVH